MNIPDPDEPTEQARDPSQDLATRIRARFATLADIALPIAPRDEVRQPPLLDDVTTPADPTAQGLGSRNRALANPDCSTLTPEIAKTSAGIQRTDVATYRESREPTRRDDVINRRDP